MTFFQSKTSKFKAAMATQDIATISQMLEAGYDPWRHYHYNEFLDTCSPAILKMYLKKMIARPRVACAVVKYLAENQKYDLLEAALGVGVNFNSHDCGYYEHPWAFILKCNADSRQKIQWLRTVTATGTNKLSSQESFLSAAVQYGFPEAVDLAVSLGISPRTVYEDYLCIAARKENKVMCLHLIKTHGADIETAKRALSFKQADMTAHLFLDRLQKEINPPSQKEQATLETLAEEMKVLRDMVEEIRRMVSPDYVVKLDKPLPLSCPPRKPKSLSS